MKSQWLSLLLTVVFGPIGALYASLWAFVVSFGLMLVLVLSGGTAGFIVGWLITILVAAQQVSAHNESLQKKISHAN